MSSAPAAKQQVPLFAVCVQCKKNVNDDRCRLARHAVPCGHVVCGDCFTTVVVGNLSTGICNSPGCEQDFESLDEWPMAMCTLRLSRISDNEAAVFGDQGNVGDRPPAKCEDAECGGSNSDADDVHIPTHRCGACKKTLCAEATARHKRRKASRTHTLMPVESGPPASSDAKSGKGTRPWTLCEEHNEKFIVAEVRTGRLLCLSCVTTPRAPRTVEALESALSAAQAEAASHPGEEAAKQHARLLELKLDPAEYIAGVTKWANDETARIRELEDREIQTLRATADKLAGLVRETCARRLEVGLSVLTQRLGLAASLDEADQGLRHLPADETQRVAKTIELTAQRKHLLSLLSRDKFNFPSADVCSDWAKLPSVTSHLDGLNHTRPPLTSAELVLHELKSLWFAPSRRSFEPMAPALCMPAPYKSPRILSMGGIKPKILLSLDDDTVAIGFDGSLQVWDLSPGRKVRDLQCGQKCCDSLALIRPGLIAAGCRDRTQAFVFIIDTTSGKLLQQLAGHTADVRGLVFVSGVLLSHSADKSFRVWKHDATWQVRAFIPSNASSRAVPTSTFTRPSRPPSTILLQFSEYAKHKLSLIPFTLTPLSSCTVAIGGHSAPEVQIWDWMSGRKLRTLGSVGGLSVCSVCSALLSDGRLCTVDWGGIIRVGRTDDWTRNAVTTYYGGDRLCGLVVAREGFLVTANQKDGEIRVWRDGTCVASLRGGYSSDDNDFHGNSLALVGGRILAAGRDNTVLVFE